jgi:hypothetical protein
MKERKSELWITVAVIAAATVLRATGKISDEMWALVASGNAGVYALARTAVKVRGKRR